MPTGPPPAHGFPVLAFIYGGAFIIGSSASSLYDAQQLASLQDVIVVTFNYRLGPFGIESRCVNKPLMPLVGFLALSELATEGDGQTGNYGILDQQMALRWIQANIAAFGGAPNRVMLFGESAGCVLFHCATLMC